MSQTSKTKKGGITYILILIKWGLISGAYNQKRFGVLHTNGALLLVVIAKNPKIINLEGFCHTSVNLESGDLAVLVCRKYIIANIYRKI